MASRHRAKRPSGRRQAPGGKRWWRRWLLRLAGLLLVAAVAWVGISYLQLVFTFQKRLGGSPSQLYSAPLVLRPGSAWSAAELVDELNSRGYTAGPGSRLRPGQYLRQGDRVDLSLRAFLYGGGRVEGYPARLHFSRRTLTGIDLLPGGEPLDLLMLEPRPLGIFHSRRNQLREPLALKDLPNYLIAAVLEVEDRRFRTHSGLDPRGIGRALWEDLWAGRVEQGGSTITQQVLKNVMLDPQRRWGRKLREMVMAPLLETLLEKDEILEIYLNEIYLGQRGSFSVVGMGAAARFYFGRGAGDLTLAQSALLAGLIRSPGTYNPWRHPQAALARRDAVLQMMVRGGQLDAAAAEAAGALPLHLSDATGEGMPEAAAFLEVTRRQMVNAFGADVLEHDGLRILTTLDTRAQRLASSILERGLRRLEADPEVARQVGKKGLQGAVVVMDPRSGAVLALVGDRQPGRGRFNRAVDARRPVGSLFKPFVYLAAFQAAARGRDGGLTMASTLVDEPLELDLDDHVWRPANSDGRFRGEISVRRALADSINIPAVKVALGVGIPAITRLAEVCGFPAGLPRVPAVALGAAEASPLEVAVAYSVLAADGRRPTPRFWEATMASGGGHLTLNEVRQVGVADAAAVYLVSDVLAEVVRSGTGRRVAAGGLTGAVAGKTGTTNRRRDAWFVGYVPGLLAVVWVGADDNRPVGLTGSQAALPIWLELVKSLKPSPGEALAPAGGLVRVRYDPETGGVATRNCRRVAEEWFMLGTEPEEECPTHGGRGFWRRLFGR
ncbi:MAG: transglycosylase domain-containing protein [Acidobacteria bacterium]|nr:transglycosylase domain-containing protein [Acidobacteriota bacterium]